MSTAPDFLAAIGPFLDPLALGLVAGGTLLAAVLRSPAGDVARAVAALPVLFRPRFEAEPLAEQIAAFGRIARRHGVLALDRSVIQDADIAAAVAAIVDGAGPEQVSELAERRRTTRIERHLGAAEVWSGMAEAAPAMGMVATLIGLVRMFAAMTDPAAIGGAMAVALLSTLYGAIVANLVAMPIANRLRAAARAEAFGRERLVKLLVDLAERERPRARSFSPARDQASRDEMLV